MIFKEEIDLFDKCVKSKGLKQSGQRRDILRTFLNTEKHLTADELFRLVKKKNPSVGVATVYRTIKLICDCGLGRELRLDKNSVRYEHLFNHDHHDHLYCKNCGELTEVVDKEIERLQEKLANKAGFKMQGHRLIIHGICKKCR
ncbi:MAG TPA: transcriptional repressor [Nitrospiraceae bacterium]|nr:transcriptional repressor [Nitrospiraceae bacterium]